MPLQSLGPDLFLWQDSCNVYVLREGDRAMLIDLGDGSVLDALQQAGVAAVEWVLFTHHHREQCLGAVRLASHPLTRETKLAAPDAERSFFEKPASFRTMKPTLNDAFTVYGSSYVRPPLTPIKIDRTFQKMDDFAWRGREFWCLDTRGNSPGAMSYLYRPTPDAPFLAFTGDLMLAGAKMHNWFDSEWDYGFAKGIYALHNAAALVEGFAPARLLPSHGPVIDNPAADLRLYQDRLRELARQYLRGYELFTFAGSDQDRVSKPTPVPHVWRVTPHLYKFRGPDYWPNFTMLLADSGRALVIDCGLFDTTFLDKALRGMKERLGLKQIDACIVTHYHGDHCLEAQWLREKWGAKLWTMDRVVDKVADPLRYNLAAPINTYGKNIDSITFDRVLRDGQTLEWEGYTLTADWMPGQTEHHLCLHGMIDGLKVAFTGDNIFANPADANQTGHEAVVSRNGCILEEGYLYAASYLHGLEPDLIIGGHSWVLPEPRQLIQRYNQSALALREAFRALSTEEDYRYTFDPFLLRADPYRLIIEQGKEGEVALYLRNYRDRPEAFRIEVLTPPGISAQPAVAEGRTPPEAAIRIIVRLKAEPQLKPDVHLVAFDLTLDPRPIGPWYDMIVNIA